MSGFRQLRHRIYRHFFYFFFFPPYPQARSAFKAQILDGVGGSASNVANNVGYWPTAEGNATTQYCDLVVDWWPDEWVHPVGYHVTVPCTGAAHRTFDSAWLALEVGGAVQMHYTPDALRDANRSTSAFGAAGLCRAHSYAMPMDVLNPMRLCTQADNQPIDPFVPPGAQQQPQWDPEACAPSPFTTPWDPAPGAPASIGTLPFDENPAAVMDLLRFNGWDPADGGLLQPLRQCASGQDCCPSCSCLLTPSGGVCAVLQNRTFECLVHAHCGSSMMCAGDGLCAQPVLEVANNATFPISFRTFSSNCSGSSSVVLDSWGLSKEEIVPDILASSGMCSYRSWYEHRQFVSSKGCTAATCTLLSTDTWNFSAPARVPQPAFSAGVLKTLPHACDVVYEHIQGLPSCSPLGTNLSGFRLVDAAGAVVATLSRVNRTRTYRLVASQAQVPVVRHANADAFPGTGFLGVNITYPGMGYATYASASAGSTPQLCSTLALCAVQSAWKLWYVNGVQEPNRTVAAPSLARLYGTDDMIGCGSMGYLSSPTQCTIDAAVAPLFYVFCAASPASSMCAGSYPGGHYAAYQSAAGLGQVASDLNGLLVSMRVPVTDWASYLAAVTSASSLYAQAQARRPGAVLYSTGAPTGLYYFLAYAAYEVPYAWWFRCSWLMGIAPGPSSAPCDAWDAFMAAAPSDPSLLGTAVLNGTGGSPPLPLIPWLAANPDGVFMPQSVTDTRNAAHGAIADTIAAAAAASAQGAPSVPFGCHAQASVRTNWYAAHPRYATAAYAHVGVPWGASTAVHDDDGSLLCSGAADCLDHGGLRPKAGGVLGYDLLGDILGQVAPTSPCGSQCACTTNMISNVCSYMQDSVSAPASPAQNWLPLFQASIPPTPPSLYAALQAKYDPRPDGCNAAFPTCSSDPALCASAGCLFAAPQDGELAYLGLSTAQVQPGTPPTVSLGSHWTLDVCQAASQGASQGARCNLNSEPLYDACDSSKSTLAKTTEALYCSSSPSHPVMFDNTNPASSQCLLASQCLAGMPPIKNSLISSIPPGINVDIVYATPVPCYVLSCDPGSEFNGRTVLDPTPFTHSVYAQNRVIVVQTDYVAPGSSLITRARRAQVLDGSDTVRLNVKFKDCVNLPPSTPALVAKLYADFNIPQCNFNTHGTRSLSADYLWTNYIGARFASDTSSSSFIKDQAYYERLLVDMVRATEDVGINAASPMSNAGLVCGQAIPGNIQACNFTTSSSSAGIQSDSLAVAIDCDDTAVAAACADIGANVCSGRSNSKTYDATACALARAEAALLIFALFPFGIAAAAAAEAGVALSPICYQGPTDFEKCMKDFTDLSTCRTRYSVKCHVYAYQRDVNHSPCTTTTSPISCPYDQKPALQASTWEQMYLDAGLPITGFCPECSSGNTCPLEKSTYTYGVAQAATHLHAFTSVPAAAGTTTGPYADHMRIGLGSLGGNYPVKCSSSGPIPCSSLHRAVQVRTGLYACAPCFSAPSTQCIGDHMCGFQNYSTFADAWAAAQARIAALTRAQAGLYATAVPWAAKAPSAYSYNPSVLDRGFNQAITKLQGQCKNSGALPDPSQCQNDGPRRALAAHVQSQYKVPEGAIVPGGGVLSWFATAAQLTTTNIPAWEARPSAPSFLQALLADSICAQFTFESMVCLQGANSTLLFNPQIAGDFEIRDGCDTALLDGTTRVVSSSCNQLTCPTRSAISDYYNSYSGLDNPAGWTACRGRDHAVAQYYTTPASVPTNLCGRAPSRPSACAAAQGVLGGSKKGLASSWAAPVSDLYGYYSSAPAPTTIASLLGMQSIAAAPPNLAVGRWDMGGHYIRMTLSPQQVLVVSGLPLRSSYATLAQAQALNGSTSWAAQWIADSNKRLASAPCASWACPFRRRFYWSAQDAAFRPPVPDPRRTAAIFGPNAAHPAAAAGPLPVALGAYATRNGFCACLNASDCLAAYAGSGNCSRADLARALVDLQPRLATVLASSMSSQCLGQQIDWPYHGGALRDGSWLPNRINGSSCGVLHRLPAFRYRFANTMTKIPVSPDVSTLAKDGGDCHMGRAAHATAPLPPSCTVVSKTGSSVTLSCPGLSSTLVLPRPSPAMASVSSTQKTPCASCAAPPVFYDASGAPLPEAEVSYGTPLWRWSPSRLLARDIRFKLCGNGTSCPAARGWTMSNFWTKIRSSTLFSSQSSPQSFDAQFASAAASPDPTDSLAWTGTPWMLCTTNSSGQTCSGTMSKADWLPAATRPERCKAVLGQPNARSAVVDLSLCDLDANMNALCSAIQNARYRIFEANCQITGMCRTTAFFYQPATYGIEDGRFARSTVANFYGFVHADACPVGDAETLAILASNAQAAQNCPAQDLEAISYALQLARETVHFFVKIAYYFGMICVQLLSLIMSSDSTAGVRNIVTYFNLIASEFQQFFATLGDVIYKMVMETGKLGQFLKFIITQMCVFLRDVFVYLVQPFICVVKSAVVTAIDAFTTVISVISVIANGALDSFRDGLRASRDAIDASPVCDMPNPFASCDSLFPADASMPTFLPLPTRCWVGYQPSIGDQAGLGCSASDTCMDDDGSLRACASCAIVGPDDAGYGCDSLTKLCRCHTVAVGKTQCGSHQECALPDTECGYVDAYLQPSFGNVPCVACTARPICLVSSSSSSSYCVCMLRSVSAQTCTTPGQRITPDPTQLCLASLGSSSVSSSASYTASWSTLVSAQCAVLNQAQTYCLAVYDTNGVVTPLAVGLSLLATTGGRRLLGVGGGGPAGANASEWEQFASEPCRSLMMMRAAPSRKWQPILGPVDLYTASECQRWRDIGERAVVRFNLTRVPPVAFTAWPVLMDLMLRDPLAARQIGAVASRLVPFLASFEPWVQPAVLVAAHYYESSPLVAALMRARNRNATNATAPAPRLAELIVPYEYGSILPLPGAERRRNGGRNLLQSSWKDSLAAVQDYTVDILASSSGSGGSVNLSPDVASAWLQGPFVWPPTYDYNQSSTLPPCIVGALIFDLTVHTFTSTASFYTGLGAPARPAVNRTLAGCVPPLPFVIRGSTSPILDIASSPSIGAALKTLVSDVLDRDAVQAYLTRQPDQTGSQFSKDITGMVSCNFDTVQHCTGFRRDLLWGVLIVAAACVLLSLVARVLGIPFADWLAALLFLPLVGYFVFGISPLCWPMVPTCALAEFTHALEFLLPASIAWPDQLQHWPGCATGAAAADPSLAWRAVPGTSACFRSCTDDWPFQFRSASDNAVWIFLRLGLPDSFAAGLVGGDGFLSQAGSFLFFFLDPSSSSSLPASVKSPYLLWPDMTAAQDVCCALTAFNLIPPLLSLLILLSFLITIAVTVPVLLVQFAIAIGVAALAFTHAGGGSEEEEESFEPSAPPAP